MRGCAVLLIALQFCWAAYAQAQTYPSRPITMIVPFAPGGTADIIARPVATKLGELLGQPVLVSNRGGVGGVLGAGVVARSENDGYTILLGSNGALTISQSLGPVPYDAFKDFEPVGIVAVSQFVLLTHPSVPARNVAELIALAKSKPGRLMYGSAGVGNVGHLAAELFASMTGVEMTHVPYAGAGPMTTDLISGRVNLAFPGLSSFVPHVKSGALRALAVTGKKRSELLPDVPTLDEANLPGYEAETFWAILAPARTPEPIIKRLNTALVQALEDPEVRKSYVQAGNEPSPSTPEELLRKMQTDTEKWKKIIQAAGIKTAVK